MANTTSAVEVQEYLANVDYPCDKESLIATAREEGADQEVIDVLEAMPDGEYGSPAEVSQGISVAKQNS